MMPRIPRQLVWALLLMLGHFAGKAWQNNHGFRDDDPLQTVFAGVGRNAAIEMGLVLTLDLTGADKTMTTLAAQAQARPLTVVAFFESWCAPCRHELPRLQQQRDELLRHGVGLIGVYSDSTDAAITALHAELQLQFPVYRTDNKVAAAQGITAVPTLIVVDTQGRVVRAHMGDDAGLMAFLQAQPSWREGTPQ